MQPKSAWDWLAVVGLWLGAALLAIRETALPLMSGAPAFFASGIWNFIPLALLTMALGIFIYRQLNPTSVPAASLPPKEREHSSPSGPPVAVDGPTAIDPADILPEKTVRQYLTMKKSRATVVQERRFMKSFVGKWMDLELTVYDLAVNPGGDIRAQLYCPDEERQPSSSVIFAFFDKKWEDHLHDVRVGDDLKFRGRVTMRGDNAPDFRECQPL
jgi:hypothetical protein